MHAIRLYGRYASISLRGQMEYRASFLMQAAGQFLITGIEFLGIWALSADSATSKDGRSEKCPSSTA